MKSMLEAGVHFGHQTSRWNPKMAKYIFGERNGVHILDLQKTSKELKKATAFIKEESKKGSKFLFVGTKKQAQDAIKTESQRCGAFCISEKWLGGTLTNFQTVKKSIERLNELEKWENEGVFKAISKKEASRLMKEMARYQKLLGGIRDMKSLPDVVFVIDPVDTEGAVRESRILGIPVVGVCDTNANPDIIDIPVPGNDDAARSIKLFCGAVADAILEGKAELEGPAQQVLTEEAAAEDAAAPKVENTAMADALSSALEESAPATEEAAVADQADAAAQAPAEEAATEEAAVKEEAVDVVLGSEELEGEEKTHGREAKQAKKEATAKKKPAAKKPAKAKKA